MAKENNYTDGGIYAVINVYKWNFKKESYYFFAEFI